MHFGFIKFDTVGIAKRGDWFCVRRANGREGRVCWGIKYRAVEHAERCFGKPWPELAKAGVRIVPVSINDVEAQDEQRRH